jgi:hypothetical protein
MIRAMTAPAFCLSCTGVVHWHGAWLEGPLTQVATTFGTTTCLDKVTDDPDSATAPQ